MNDWHRMFGGREWRVTPDGILSRQSRGEAPALHRTAGRPLTMHLYLAVWGEALLAASREAAVPAALLLMTLGTENGRARMDGQTLVYAQDREEPGYTSDDATPHRVSIGPCHLLISTARAAMKDPAIGRRWLLDPANNIRAAARYIADQRRLTGFDPILVAAAYNSGGIHDASHPGGRFHNRWHLRSWVHPSGHCHLDNAAAWYGDACRVLQEHHELVSMDLSGLGRAGFRGS